METYFFDSHGDLWMTSSPDADGSENFGPTGSAVQIDVITRSGETPWATAKRLGLVVDGMDGEFDTLVEGGLTAGNGEEPACTFNSRPGW